MNQPISYKRHYKELIYLGVPIMVGQLGTIILGFADTMMIGHHSAAELSAAGFVNTLFNLAIIFGLGFSYGLTPIVGALYGRGEEEEAGGKLKNSLLANLLIAVFLCIVMGILYLNLDKLGQPEELLPFIKPYYLILWASLPLIMLFNAFKQFADGITDTQTPMWILLGGNVLNIVGNYLLIYGTFGFPELGLLGGGLSTLFARLMMLVVFIGIFFLSPKYKTFLRGFRRSYANRADFRQLNKLGWPIALQMGMETASFSLCAIMLGWLGETPLAAHQIMNTITTLCFMIYYGMGAAIAVRVSYFRGQEDMPNLRRSAYAGFHLILVWGLFLCTIVFCIRHQLGSWYTAGCRPGHPHARLSVWRRSANCLCQRPSWTGGRQAHDVHRLCRLHHPLVADKLHLRIPPGLGYSRNMDGLSGRSDQCRHCLLPPLPSANTNQLCPPTIKRRN